MKKILTCTLCFVLIGVFTFCCSRHEGYEIVGKVTGFPDSTILFLEYTAETNSKEVKDSVYIIGGAFAFRGSLDTKAAWVALRTRGFSDYKFFWIENATITFTGKKGKFREAVITGSKTQDDDDELDAMLEHAGESKAQEAYTTFFTSHPNSPVSVHVLDTYASTWGRKRTVELYAMLSEEMKQTALGKRIQEFISTNKEVKVGDKFVDFTQNDVHGRPIKLSDFTGKVVLLEFWGSWCAPCRKAHPELVDIYHEFRNDGFEILGVGAETNESRWLKAIEDDKLPWTNVTDLKYDRNHAALIYGVSYFPANFLIDRNGTIISRDLQGDSLRIKLKELL